MKSLRNDIFNLMKDGKWRSLASIASATDGAIDTVSARLRDLRKTQFGGHKVETRKLEKNTYEYRVEVKAAEGTGFVPASVAGLTPERRPSLFGFNPNRN